MGNEARELIAEISRMMKRLSEALERRAEEIQATGGDSELAGKLAKGADAMRDSGNLYLTWARHYVALSEGTSDAADEADEADFGT
ncbi:MAG: hypothetical protein E6K69_05810 [Nitrospirae bacterium]|nr:MAG: hypothetical protein E6K69_05810 [Nitrospirota bacterium]